MGRRGSSSGGGGGRDSRGKRSHGGGGGWLDSSAGDDKVQKCRELVKKFQLFCYAVDTITQGQTVADGDTLTSEDQTFELGFFSPENSTLRFVGIWYKIDVQAVVWVANRDSPISNRNGVFGIGVDGNLVVLNGNNSLVWSSNVTGLSNNTAAVLQNTGNLVLSNNDSVGDTSRAHWQSFDEPTDTFLPGMRVPVNSAIGESRVFRSWKSASDPSPGNYTMGVDPNGGPQIVIWDHMGRRWRSGQWNSVIFTGIPNMSNIASFLYGFKLSQPDENRTQYFTYDPSDPSDLLRFRLSWDGREHQLRWDDDGETWTMMQTQPDPANICDIYNHCGDHAVCDNLKAPKCSCLDGFRPRVPNQWSRGNWSGGCERRVQLQCQRTNGTTTNTTARQNGEQDGFKGTRRVKLPDSSSLLLSAMNADACKSSCLGNCSCTAYAFVSGIGCMIWEGDLVDLQHVDQAGTLQFFYRVHNSELVGYIAEIAHLNINSAAFHCIALKQRLLVICIMLVGYIAEISAAFHCIILNQRLTTFFFTSIVDGGRKISNTVIIVISVLGACLLVDSAMHRPTMAAVVLMLESEAPMLPIAKQPTYTSMRSLVDADYSMDILHETASASSKDITVTMIDGR
ncbi:hypothetical protein V6N12_029260 [Hibiscus sabdariffa]|uniref:Uncharacterized protein n=1 Tax=Hibiscus sabdariffa TaxID=183260 RepID=A0ABR2CVL2_9ROSI